MSAWDQFVLGIGYVSLAGSAGLFLFALGAAWVDHHTERRKEREVNELERMYEGK